MWIKQKFTRFSGMVHCTVSSQIRFYLISIVNLFKMFLLEEFYDECFFRLLPQRYACLIILF